MVNGKEKDESGDQERVKKGMSRCSLFRRGLEVVLVGKRTDLVW